MVTNQIRFADGATYERYIGKWSQLAGETFLDWLAPKSGLRWLDVGCGNGAFMEMLVERCVVCPGGIVAAYSWDLGLTTQQERRL